MAQLSVIDLLVVIMLGSAVETAMVRSQTSLSAGLVSAATLFIANHLITLAFVRFRWLRKLLGFGPVLVVSHGHMVTENLKRQGLTEDDVIEGLRSREIQDIHDVRFAFFEADGTMNVIRTKAALKPSSDTTA